jgi:Ca2+-binding EF-hand superfamily protein
MDGTFSLTETGEKESTPLPVTNQEEKELRRVFNMLCDYSRKVRIQSEIEELRHLLTGGKQRLKEVNEMSTAIVNLERFENNAEACHKRIDELIFELENVAANPNKKISIPDVSEMIKKLKGGKAPNKLDVQEMLWEVDEDLDQCLNWPEFKLMFTRNILDQTGLEPSRMFFLTQFLIYDHNENGKVSVDETMNMLYARYGRATMEKKLKELFGDDMHETGREGGEIQYDKFVAALQRVQLSTFWNTTKGKNIANKGGLKKAKKDDEDSM